MCRRFRPAFSSMAFVRYSVPLPLLLLLTSSILLVHCGGGDCPAAEPDYGKTQVPPKPEAAQRDDVDPKIVEDEMRGDSTQNPADQSESSGNKLTNEIKTIGGILGSGLSRGAQGLYNHQTLSPVRKGAETVIGIAKSGVKEATSTVQKVVGKLNTNSPWNANVERAEAQADDHNDGEEAAAVHHDKPTIDEEPKEEKTDAESANNEKATSESAASDANDTDKKSKGTRCPVPRMASKVKEYGTITIDAGQTVAGNAYRKGLEPAAQKLYNYGVVIPAQKIVPVAEKASNFLGSLKEWKSSEQQQHGEEQKREEEKRTQKV